MLDNLKNHYRIMLTLLKIYLKKGKFMSKSLLNIAVRTRQVDGTNVWEAIASIPGLQATKVVRRTTNTTTFATRSALLSAARSLALGLGFSGIMEVTPVKKVATKKVQKLVLPVAVTTCCKLN